MTTINVTCGKCDGSGRLSWTRVANGVCFACEGTGRLTADASDVSMSRSPRAEIVARIKRCLDRMATTSHHYGDAFVFADEPSCIGRSLAHADADVRTRALAALVRLGASDVDMHNVLREEEAETAKLVAGVRRIVRSAA